MTEMFDPSEWRHSAACPHCRYALPPFENVASEYFSSGYATCPTCSAKVDLWAELIADVKDVFAPWSLRALGAAETDFWFELAAGELKPLDFVTAGVPAAAEIIMVDYLPHGGNCFAVETVPYHVYRRGPEKKTGIVGAPLQGVTGGSARVRASVYWILGQGDSEPWRLIADALAAAAKRDYVAVIPPAHAAVEIAVSRLIADVLRRAASNDAVQHFMQNDLTSSSATNVMLPFLCKGASLPPLSENIRGRLTRLRGLRNQLAHGGTTPTPIDEREVRELAVAAVFAFEFVRLIRPKLLAADLRIP